MSAEQNKNKKFMPHVNGLRALAISGIVLYHLQASYCPAGYFGVDVFLVISGYFLYGSLLDKGSAGAFSFTNYWLGKAWRIVPSWFVVILATAIVVSLLTIGYTCGSTYATIHSSSKFMADMGIDTAGDYFNPTSHVNPLLHLWYLSLTMQLYIVAPLIIIPLVKWVSRRLAVAALTLVFFASLGYYVATTAECIPFLTPPRRIFLLMTLGFKSAYYHLIPRIWETIAGLFILYLPRFENKLKLQRLLAWLGTGGIVFSFFHYETGSASVYLAVASTMLVIRYGGSGAISRVLDMKAIRFIGTISFSLYLWHWPIMVLYKYFSYLEVSLADDAAMLLLSIAGGYLAWRYIEQPIRMPRNKPLLRWALLTILPAVYFTAPVLSKSIREANDRLLAEAAQVENMPFPQPFPLYKQYLEDETSNTIPIKMYHVGDKDAPARYLFIGDSHTIHLIPGIHQQFTQAGIGGTVVGPSSIPFWHYEPKSALTGDAQWGRRLAENILDYLQLHEEIRCVVISLYWNLRFNKMDGIDWRDKVSVKEKGGKLFAAMELRETCRLLKENGKEVIFIAEVPYFPAPTPFERWKQEIKLHGASRSTSVLTDAGFRADTADDLAILQEIRAEGLASGIIDPTPILLQDGGYPAFRDGGWVYCDSNHFSEPWSICVGSYVARQLIQRGETLHEDGQSDTE